jgi:peptidoglycan/xylan/chitin deacetylase (PgdA/CDA1 family)
VDLEEGAAGRAARLSERRRRRRQAERRRRAQLRRRNLLTGAAIAAFVVGLARGAGGDPGPGEAATQASGPEGAEDAPLVDDFHEPVPILMYHGISPPPAGTQYPELFVPEAEFEEQMEWLAERGYHAVTLDEVFAAWHDGEPIAAGPVVISFDDGLRSQYVGARPVLERLGWPAVLNLKVESVDQGELTEAMVEELIAAGWEVDSHTIAHGDVSELDGAALRREVSGSRRELIERFGEPVDFFAYPAGAYDSEAIAAVEDAGYQGAVTTDPGLASPDEPYRLKRIRIAGGEGAEGLESSLADAGSEP